MFLVGVVCASDYTDDSKTINTPQLEQKDTYNIEVYNTKNDYTNTNKDVKKSVKETTKNNTELTDKKTLEKDMLSQDDLKNAVKSSTLTVDSAKNVYVGNQMSIYGKLSADGLNIPYETVTIKVDGKKYNVTTSKYGNYNIKITPTSSGNKTIIATFYGSDKYGAATISTTFQANKKSTLITLGCTKNVTVGDTVKIYGKLTDQNGKNLANQTVKVNVNGKTYTLTTTKYGNYYLNVTATITGKNNITSTYYGTKVYSSNSNKTYFKANKKTTSITVNSTKNVYVGNVVKILGKLTDQNGKYVANQNIDLYIDNEHYNITTTKYGNYYYNYTTKTAGTHTITVKYTGTNNYTGSKNNTYFNATKKTGLITLVTTKNVYVGGTVKIYGKVTANNKYVPYQEVTITVDGKKYNLTTSKYGNYNMNFTATSEGYKKITASYAGTDAITGNTNSTYFNATKKGTTITLVSTKSVTVGNIVKICGKLTDQNGKYIANQRIDLYIDNEHYNITTTKYGNYYYNYTTKTAGTHSITVKYYGTNIYTNSTNTTYFNVAKKTTSITVSSTSNVYVGNSIFIYGTLKSNGQNLAYKTVKINADDKTYYVTTSQYGYYSIYVSASSTGNKIITATFNADDYYYGSSSITTTNVIKKDTKITLDPIETKEYLSVLRLTGKLTDNNGNNLNSMNVNFNINGRKYTVTTDNYGEFALNYQTRDVGQNNITVSYSGNNIYTATSIMKTFMVTSKTTKIEVFTSSNYVKYLDYISIGGYYEDWDGNPLTYTTLSVNVNGQQFYTKTGEYGYYSMDYKTNKVGINTVTVSYPGNIKYKGTSTSTTFTVVTDTQVIVEKIPSHLTVSSTVKQSNGEYITIKGQLYDLSGNMISYAPLTLTIDGQKYTTTTDNYGSYSYNYKGNPNITHVLTVNYAGNTKYDKTQTQITFKAQENDNTIEILIPHTKEYYYDDYGELQLYTENYEDISIMDAVHLGSDTIIGTTQYLEGQFMAGSRLMQNGIVIEIAPANTMIKAEFYFKNRYGDIKIVTEYSTYVDNCIDTELISGYIPYKAVLTYRQKSPSEIKEWYEYNDEYYVAQY